MNNVNTKKTKKEKEKENTESRVKLFFYKHDQIKNNRTDLNRFVIAFLPNTFI